MPDEMAAHDLYVWQQQIQATLPGEPTGTIDVDEDTEPTTYTIQITWREAGNADDDTALSYTMRMQI